MNSGDRNVLFALCVWFFFFIFFLLVSLHSVSCHLVEV